MNRRNFVAAMLATIPVGLVAMKMPTESLQELIDRGGLIEGRSFVIRKPLIVTNNHDFQLKNCKLKVECRRWMDMEQRTKPKGTVVIEGCTIDFKGDLTDYGLYDGVFVGRSF